MKIGYPCINRTLECKGNRTFRLRSYTPEKLRRTVETNLDCLVKILEYNLAHDILFFRITSQLVPFASHPVCSCPWQKEFKKRFWEIGRFIKKHAIRISMHPDQFIVLNAEKKDVVKRSIAELSYHARVLDLMELDSTAKIQLHVGGVYGDKQAALKRFAGNYQKLSSEIRRRLVIENDDRSYTIADCLKLHGQTKVPVLFDVFHDSLNPGGFFLPEVFTAVARTWKKKDGLPMVDFSLQNRGKAAGAHAEAIDIRKFGKFLAATEKFDFDIMLEIKEKAVARATRDTRFFRQKKA